MIAPCEGRHELIILMKTRDEAPDTFKVVRWCRNCGAVVIDPADASTWTTQFGYGKTPGERMTDARRRALAARAQ